MRVARVRFPAKPFFKRKRREEKRKKKEEGRGEIKARAFLAQSVERAAFNRKVVGSSPTGGVFFKEKRKKRGGQEGTEEEKE